MNPNCMSTHLATAIMALTLLTWSTTTRAQERNAPAQSRGHTAAPEVLDPESVDDATLKKSADAFVKVSTIIKSGKQAFDSAADDSQKQQIKEQVARKKLAAVQASGLPPQKFNQVLELVQVDQPLRQKFLSYVKQAKSEPGSTR
jgi:hypothetical protein